MEHFSKTLINSKIKTLGIEPSSNVANVSKAKGIKTINNFFYL